MSTSYPTLLTPHANKGTVLAFDYGEKRTGVAVGDLSLRIAHPLTAIETTHAAGLSLRESGAASTKTRLDQLAAQQILQDYFDELA